jgi:hypothetical protein
MATAATLRKKPDSSNRAELDNLAGNFFKLAETRLAKMAPERREAVVASVHATAESLRAEKFVEASWRF